MLCDNRICDICQARGDDCSCSPEDQFVVRMANNMLLTCQSKSASFAALPYTYKIELMIIAARSMLKKIQQELKFNCDNKLIPTLSGGYDTLHVPKPRRRTPDEIKIDLQPIPAFLKEPRS